VGAAGRIGTAGLAPLVKTCLAGPGRAGGGSGCGRFHLQSKGEGLPEEQKRPLDHFERQPGVIAPVLRDERVQLLP
jgi:hypothetical protein